MIKLATLFQSGMLLQRGKAVRIWGESDCEESIEVRINDEKIAVFSVPKGKFSLLLPAQPARENVRLQVGNVVLERVDFGEVWIAGGQSNMQFYVKWDADREEIFALPSDEHIRYYEVSKYTFEGEEKDGFKDASHWDKWFSFNRETCPYFSAVATWFAIALRKELGVPVGIVSCNLGATSASAWMDENLLRADEELKVYVDAYEASVQGLDMARYEEVNRFVRAFSAGSAEEAEDYMHRETGVTPQQFNEFLAKNSTPQENVAPFGDFSVEELTRPGPHEPHPGSLYRVMLKKIIGFTCRGVIWYQGCQDECRAQLYQKLFTALIGCWRRDWGDELPFIYAQLAPFGSWWGNTGTNFPAVRAAQAAVEENIPKAYMVSTSDVGCENDIHPKHKKKVGERMALRALDKVYGKNLQSDAPRFLSGQKEKNALILQFEHAQHLYIEGASLSALCVSAEGAAVEKFTASAEDNRLVIRAEQFAAACRIEVQFACTPYYKVNLYNEAELPAVPFAWIWEDRNDNSNNQNQ